MNYKIACFSEPLSMKATELDNWSRAACTQGAELSKPRCLPATM